MRGLKIGKSGYRVFARNAVDRSRMKTEICQAQLGSPHTCVREQSGREFLELVIQAHIVTVNGVVRAVVTSGERSPVMRLKRAVKACRNEERCHCVELLVFGFAHGRDHAFYSLKSCTRIV